MATVLVPAVNEGGHVGPTVAPLADQSDVIACRPAVSPAVDRTGVHAQYRVQTTEPCQAGHE